MSADGAAPRVGVLPLGALGAAYFHHLSSGRDAAAGDVRLIGRRDSRSGEALRRHGTFRIGLGEEVRDYAVADVFWPDLVTAADAGWLPDVLLIAPQPEQLLSVMTEVVSLLEKQTDAAGLDAAIDRLPVLVLCSNGIYHERVRRFLVELLEESMLFGRLPDLWAGGMGRIVGKLIRGVTMQTGLRAGEGADAVYRPGPPAQTTLAGGDAVQRTRAADILGGLGGMFSADQRPPVRVEFSKALINLWGNLLGQIKAIDEDGTFRNLRVREILTDIDEPDLRELSGHLFAVGSAVRAYDADADFDQLHRNAFALASTAGEHVPSSLQLVASQLETGRLTAELSPTERWLLEPLMRYANAAGLGEAETYFRALGERLQQKLAAAASR